jgi:hypothetical protein
LKERRGWRESLTDWKEWKTTLRGVAILGLGFVLLILLLSWLDQQVGWSHLPPGTRQAIVERLGDAVWGWVFDHWQFWLLLIVLFRLGDPLERRLVAVLGELQEIKERLPEPGDDPLERVLGELQEIKERLPEPEDA